MHTPHVGIVTCRELPEPDHDEHLLVSALGAAGARVSVRAWDDPGVRWNELDLAVVRSTWNYYLHLDRFLTWVEATAAETRLFNAPATIRANTHKGYLVDLAARGIPVVPTELVPRGSAASLATIMAKRGWRDVVVKPAVSAGSFDTHKVGEATVADGERELARMLERGDVLVQGYVRSVEGYGERSMIVIDGELTHAIRKSPRFSGGVEQVSEALPIADDERRTALSIVSSLAERVLYARVDLARDEVGTPMVMELELVEPSLFLAQHPPALERFVRAILARAVS